MAGNNTDNLKEFKASTSERTEDDTEITKMSILVFQPDPEAILENVGPCDERTEETINEKEANAEVESETGSDSVVEIGQQKPESKSDTPGENTCDNLSSNGVHDSSNADAPIESNEIDESGLSKKTVNIIATGNVEESDNRSNDVLTNECRCRHLESRIKETLNHGETKNDGDGNDKKPWKKVGLFALKTVVLSGVILGGTALIVPAIGFGALGVTGGSLAAAYQSAVLGGTIASGSAFATLQSIGMVGLSAAAQTTVVAGSAVASGAHTLYKSSKKK